MKVLETKYKAPMEFCGGGGGGGASKQNRAMEGTWIFSGTAHYCKCKM